MKKCIYLALCLCTLITCIGCTSDSGPEGELSDTVEFKVFDDNSKIWLDNSHIQKVSLETDETGRKILIFTTTEKGKTLLNKATTENVGGYLSVSADEYLLTSAMVTAPIEDGRFAAAYKAIDYTYLYNYLTGAKDKMTGVELPHNILSETVVKQTVFERANTTEENVSGLKIELKIDPEYFGWAYYIEFTADNKTYIAEVNAITGGVTRFTH